MSPSFDLLRWWFRRAVLPAVPVACLLASVEGAGEPWQEIKGEHFLVCYVQDRVLAEAVCRAAEDCYSKITADIGFTKRDSFWTWENRTRIYIYPSKKEFASETGAPEWAGGRAAAKKREISTFAGHPNFMVSVLPHEMTHLILRDFVGFDEAIPLWFNEGLAQWEEETPRKKADASCLSLLKRNQLIPFQDLVRMDVRTLENSKKVVEFYAQSLSLVSYLIQRQGSDGFKKLCGQIRDGKSMDDALGFAYPGTIRNMQELGQAWRKYLAESPEVTP